MCVCWHVWMEVWFVAMFKSVAQQFCCMFQSFVHSTMSSAASTHEPPWSPGSMTHNRAQRLVQHSKYLPLDDKNGMQMMTEMVQELDQWDRAVLHAAGDESQQMKHDITQRADRKRLADKKKMINMVDHGDVHFNHLVKNAAMLAAKDWIWLKKPSIEAAAITKYKKSAAFKAELQKAKMEQKKVDETKKKIMKVGSFATKIRKVLKQLPPPIQQQLVEKHGLEMQKELLDKAAQQELRPKWIGIGKNK